MGDGPDVVAAQDLRLAIGRVARRLRQLYATEREGAANSIELGILVRLDREGPTSPSTLAAGEGVTSQAIAGVVREFLVQPRLRIGQLGDLPLQTREFFPCLPLLGSPRLPPRRRVTRSGGAPHRAAFSRDSPSCQVLLHPAGQILQGG